MHFRDYLNKLRAEQPKNEPYDFEDPEFIEIYRKNLHDRMNIKTNPEVVNTALLNELHRVGGRRKKKREGI